MKYKIGLGYDLHRLKRGRKLFLGGLEIPFSKGLAGHSDGDCLIHAIIDALLGALGERDIGQLFPDSDPKYKDIRSTELLKEVMAQLKRRKLEVIHVDSVVVAEEPKLGSYLSRMKGILCPILRIDRNDLGIKAKTNEGMGLIGQKQAIACWAVVLAKVTERRRKKA